MANSIYPKCNHTSSEANILIHDKTNKSQFNLKIFFLWTVLIFLLFFSIFNIFLMIKLILSIYKPMVIFTISLIIAKYLNIKIYPFDDLYSRMKNKLVQLPPK